jgi:predicted MFS family arabinose efflux permease
MNIRETYIFSFLVLLPSIPLVFMIATTKKPPNDEPRKRGYFIKVFKNRSIIFISLSVGVFFLLQSALTFYPLYALQQFKLDPSNVALIISAMYLASMMARILVVSRVNSREAEKRLIKIGLMISASIALMPLTGGLALSAIVLALVGVAHGIIYPMGAMIINTMTPPEERGTANSIFILMVSLNSTLGPTVMGFAAGAWGLTLLFPILAAASVIGLISSRYVP